MTGRRIVIVAFESAQVLDVTGPLEVFSTASRFWPAADYHTELVSPRGGPVQTSSGLTFATGPVAGVDGGLDTLVVAGGRDTDAACADEELLHHVWRLASTARRVTSVCALGPSCWPRRGCSTGAGPRRTGPSASSSSGTIRTSGWKPTPSTSAMATRGPPRE